MYMRKGVDGSCVPGWGAGWPSQQSLEVESPGVGDIEGLGLAAALAALWSGIEDIHTLAAGGYYISHEAGAVTADILQDTAMGIDVGELLLYAPPLWSLQGSRIERCQERTMRRENPI